MRKWLFDRTLRRWTAGFVLGWVLAAPLTATAQPVPSVNLAPSPMEPFVSEDFSFTATVENSAAFGSGFNGFNMELELLVPPQVTLAIPVASGVFGNLTPVVTIVVPPAGSVTNPITGEVLSGLVPGMTYFLFEIPLGTVTPETPAMVINFQATVSPTSLPNVALAEPITAIGVFALGTDPLANPSVDPPIRNAAPGISVLPLPSTQGVAGSAPVVPILYIPTKTATTIDGNGTATGPNYPVTYDLEVDIANGSTLTPLTFSETLPDNLRFSGVTDIQVNASTGDPNVTVSFTRYDCGPSETPVVLFGPAPLSTIVYPLGHPDGTADMTQPPNDVPGGCLSIVLSSATGEVGAGDIVVEYETYVPREDATGAKVLPTDTGTDNLVTNTVTTSATSASGGYGTVSLVGADITTDPAEVTAESINTQKSAGIVIDNNTADLSPGDVIRVTISGQISDYFSHDQLAVHDVVGDGLDFDILNAANPILTLVREDGENLAGTPYAFTIANVSPAPDRTNPGEEYPFPAAGTLLVTQNARPGEATGASPGFTTLVFDLSSFWGHECSLSLSPCLVDADCPGVETCVLSGDARGGFIDALSAATGFTVGIDDDTRFVLTYDLTLQEAYENPVSYTEDASIDATDAVSNAEDINGEVTSDPAGQFIADPAGAGLVVPPTQLEKELVALNGNGVLPSPVQVSPGDDVTYALRVTIPTGDLEINRIEDYLPLPIFHTEDPDADGVNSAWTFDNVVLGAGVYPAAGHAAFGPGTSNLPPDYVPTDNPPVVIATVDANSVGFNFPDEITFQVSTPQQVVVEVYFTVRAGYDPFADNLFLTNLAEATFGNSLNTVTNQAAARFIERQPALRITKGVAATTGGGTISPSPLALPVDGDLAGADAGDVITYVITVENRGGYAAYDVVVTDPEVAGMDVGSCTLISVTYGDGSALTSSGDLATGLAFGGPLALNDGTLGAPFSTDAALITVDCTMDASVEPHDQVVNFATITGFASRVGGPNFVDPGDPSAYQDDAVVTMAPPAVAKVIESVTPEAAGPGSVTAGDVLTYAITVTLPEGVTTGLVLVDTLPAGFEYLAGTVAVDTTGFVGSVTTSPTVATGGSVLTGQTITLTFGTATTTDDNVDTNDSFLVRLDARVRGDLVQNDGLPAAQTKTNTVTLDYDTNPGGPLSATATTQFEEPDLQITKTVNPNLADASDVLTVTLVVTNVGTAPAYDVVVTDPLDGNLFDLLTITEGTTPADFVYAYASPTVTYTMNPAVSILPGGSRTFTFTGQIRSDVVIQTSYSNTADVDSDTQDGTVTSERAGNAEDSDTVLIDTVTVVKSLIATSEPATSDAALGANPPVAIGEVLTYRIRFTLPEGTLRSVRLADVLPTGIQHIPGTATLTRNSAALVAANNVGDAPSAGINVDAAGTAVPITLSGVTGEILIDLGDVFNSDSNNATDEIYTLELQAVVLNSASNNAGVTRDNRGRFRFVDGSAVQMQITSALIRVHIAEPIVNVVKTANPTSGSAGDTVTFTLVIANTASGGNATTGFEWAFTDTLPPEYINPLVTGISIVSAPGAVASASFAGNVLSGTIDELDPGESITVTYTADIDVTALFGQQLLNTASATATSLLGTNGATAANPGVPGGATGERTGTGGVNDLFHSDNATVDIDLPTITKTTVNPQSWFAVGEKPRFRITVGVPAGTTNSFVVSDVLPAGLSFDTGTVTVTPPPGLTSSNSPLTEANAAFFTQAGQNLTFNFGTATIPSAGSIVIEYDTTVRDILANQDGTILVNTATLTFEDPDNPPATLTIGPVVNDTPVRVGEPDLEMSKTILSGAVGSDAGDTVTWQLTFTNTGHTTAWRSDWTDVLPDGGGGPGAGDGLEQISNVIVGIAGGTVLVRATGLPVTAGDAVISTTTNLADTIALPQFDIAPGATLTVTFDSVVGSNAVIGAALLNVTSATYDSLPAGTDGRDASSGPGVDDDDDTDLDNYEESANQTLTLGARIAIGKSVSPTVYTIGEDVSFLLRLDISEGVTLAVTVTDELPAGLTYRSSSISAGNVGIAFSNPTYATPIIGGGGQDISFSFGRITNPPDASTLDDFVDITIVARVDNILANQDGTILENNTHVIYGIGATRLDFDSDGVTPGIQGLDVEVVEPDLQITKTVAPSSQSLGDTVTFTVTVAHSPASTHDAFDLSLVDLLPVGLTIDPLSVTLPPLDYVVAGQMLTVTRSSLTILDGSFSFTYQASIDTDAVVGQPLTNGIDVVWSSIPGATGDPDDGRTGSGGVNDYSDADDDTVVPDIDAFIDAVKTVELQVDADFSATVTPGDTLRYEVVLTNDLQAVGGVTFSDAIPAGTTYVPASLTSDAGTVDDSGAPTLTVDVGAMAFGATVTIVFDVTVDVGTPAGTTLCNQGSVDSDETVPEPSDVDAVDANGDQCTPSVVGQPPVPANELYVEKRVSLLTDVDASGSVTAGDELEYLLVFHNLGDQDLTTVTLTDTIPLGLTGVAASGTIGGAGSLITVTTTTVATFIPTIAVAGSETATFVVTVDAPLYDGSGDGDPNRETFVNQGVADSDQTGPEPTDEDGDPTDGDDPTDIDAVDGVPGTPSMDLQKRVALAIDVDGDGIVDPGDTLVYSLTLTNSGSAAATNVVVTDPEPNDTGIVTASTATSQGIVVSESPVTVNVGTMGAGDVVTVTFRVVVDAALASCTIVVNQASATGDNFAVEASDDNGDDSDGENANRTPIDDTAPGLGSPCQPAFAKALVASSEPDTAGLDVVVGEIVTFRLTATLPAGLTRQVRITDSLPTGLAYVAGSATLTRIFDTALESSADPASIDSAASGVAVALADGTDLVVSGQDLTVFLGDVLNSDSAPNDERYLVEVRAIVRNVVANQFAVPLVNAAEMSFWNGLGQTTLASDSETLTVLEPEIAIVKTATPSPVSATGDTVTFTITVTNTLYSHDATAWDVRVLDTVPPELSGVSAVAAVLSGGASGLTDASAGSSIDVTIDEMPPGAQAVLTFTAAIAPPYSTPSVTNTANVAWSTLPGDNGTAGANPNPSGDPLGERNGVGGVNDHATSDPAVIETPVLHLSKVDDPDAVAPGGTLTYTIFLTNTASAPLTNVVLTESYDSRTTFVSAVPAPSAGDNIWSIGTLDSGESTTITIVVSVDAGLADGAVLLNHAEVVSDGGGFADDDEPTTIADPSVTRAQIHVQKGVDQLIVPSGAVVTYTITVRNDGLATSYDTLLSDTMPPELTYANAVPAPALLLGNYAEWDIGDLPPGASRIIQVYAFTDPTLIAGTVIENCGDAVGQTGPGTTSSVGLQSQGCVASTVNGPGTDCGLVSRKRSVGIVVPNNEFVYRCLWCDPCVDAHDVVIIDDLPPQLELISVSSKDADSIVVSGQRVTIGISRLPAGRAGVADIRVRVRDDAAIGTVLTNDLVLTDAALREAIGTDVAVVRSEGTNPRATPSLKVSGTKRAIDGGTLSYGVRYANLPQGSTLTMKVAAGIDVSLVSPSPSRPTASLRSTGDAGLDGSLLVWDEVSGSGTIKMRGTAAMAAGVAAEIVAVDVMSSDGSDEIHSGIDTVLSPSGGGSSGSPGAGADVTLSAPRYAKPGDETQLSLRFRGLAGTGDASVSLPVGLALVSAQPTPTVVNGNLVSWEGLTALSGSIKVRVKVSADVLPGTVLAVTSTVTDTRGSVGDNLSLTVREGTETASPDLEVTAPSFVVAGAQTSVTVRVSSIANGAVVDLVLPTGVSFVSSIPAASSTEAGRVRWSLAASTSTKLSVRLAVGAGVPAGSRLLLGASLVDSRGTSSSEATMTVR